MYPNKDKVDQEYRNSIYSSVLEQPDTSMTPVHGSAPLQGIPNTFLSSKTPHVSPFRLNSKALIITVSVLSLLAVGGIGLVVLKSPKATTTPNSQYSVGNLPLNGVRSNSELLVGKLDQLTINGLLQANNTLILNPTITPTTPVTGQIYYDSVTNQPYFYNGTKFVSLNPTTPVAGTSLGGLTGAIGLGQGLTVAGNQLGLANSFTSSLVTNITGTTNQINVSASTGNIKLSLPQDLAVTSSPTFGGLTVNGNTITTGNSVTSGNSTVIGNHTVQGQLTVNSASTFSGTATFDATAKPTGYELITNGTFTGNTSGWTLGNDVTYNSGTQNVTSTYTTSGNPKVSTTFASVAGNTYLLTFTVSAANAPMYFYFANNTSSNSNANFTNGQATVAFKATYTGIDTIYFIDWNYTNGDTWTLDNFSLKQTTSVSSALKVVGFDGTTWLSLGNDLLGNTALGQGTFQNNTSSEANTATGFYALSSITASYQNTATGFYALSSSTTGSFNTATGSNALQFNTTGSQNTANGIQALYSNTTGFQNTANGSQILYSNTTGFQNTANGTYALYSNTTGSRNTANGFQALYSNTTGFYNTASGSFALQANNTGNYNTANGYSALISSTTGSNNIALGYYAGNNLTTGSNNVAIGASTSFASATADNQLQIGVGISGDLALGTLAVKTTGSDSASAFTVQDHNSNSVLNVDTTNSKVTIGSVTNAASLEINGTAQPIGPELVTNGTFTGSAAGWTLGSNVTYNSGTNNVNSTYAVGDPSLSTTFATVTGNTYRIKFDISSANASMDIFTSNNTNTLSNILETNGTNTLYFKATYTGTDTITFDDHNYTIGDTWTLDNVSIKQVSNKPALNVIGADGNSWLTLGNDINQNTAIGLSTLQSNTSGYNNTATGSSALQSNTSGNNDTATGYRSLQSNTSGYNNTATGSSALQSNTSGNYNTANGGQALLNNTTGDYNTAIGVQALYSNTTGFNNIATGPSALYSNTTGSSNTSTGAQALQFNTTGNFNTATGLQALDFNTTGNNNTATGIGALAYNTTGSYNSATGDKALLVSNTGSNNTASGTAALKYLNTRSDIISGTAYNAGKAQFTSPSSWGLVAGATVIISGTASYNGNQTIFTIDDAAHFTITTAYTTADTTGSWTTVSTDYNTSLGFQAGSSIYNGYYAAVGGTYVGANTGLALQTGADYNTLVGYSAGSGITTGTNNLLLGFNAGTALTSGSDNVGIGQNVAFASNTGSNQLQIGAGISGDLANGTLQIKTVNNSASAFVIQDTSSNTLFNADTTGLKITISGTPSNFATLTLTDSHFKSTQTNAPTIGTPSNCGVTPTAVVTAGSTDTAGSFVITAGTGSPTTCDTVFSFNKAYGAAPKSVVISSTKAVGSATAERAATVSAASANNFTLKVNTGLGSNTPVAGEVISYYYFVIE